MITLLSLAMACALDADDNYKTPRQCVNKLMDVVEYVESNPEYTTLMHNHLSGCPNGPATNKQASADARVAGESVGKELIKGLSSDYKKGDFHWMAEVNAGDAFIDMLSNLLARKWGCKKISGKQKESQ